MKLFTAVFSAFTLQSVNALQCWTCEEKSHADCLTYGVSDKEFPDIDCPILVIFYWFQSLVTCPLAGEPTNEDLIKSVVCGVMEHQRLGNRVNHVIAGCRQFEACYNDWSQNFISPTVQATFQQAVDYRLCKFKQSN